MAIVAISPMRATTTMISISVKPPRRKDGLTVSIATSLSHRATDIGDHREHGRQHAQQQEAHAASAIATIITGSIMLVITRKAMFNSFS